MNIVYVTDDTFDIVNKYDKCVVYFSAEWCAPCKSLSPLVEGLKDNIQVVKADIESCPKAGKHFSVRAVPTLVLLKNGIVDGVKTGLLSEAQLKLFLEV